LRQELIDSGVPPEKTRRVRHILTNTVGGTAETVSQDVAHLPLENGDRMLLCTDGLTELVSDRGIVEIVGRPIRSQSACDTLIQLALDRGGKNNVTVVLVEFSDQSPKAATQ
jgi:serine/threonine protein phosphatase PrpC